MRVLEVGTRVVENNLVLNQSLGKDYRYITRGGITICDDADSTIARIGGYAIQARNLNNKTVAWIGGGLCVGPRIFGVAKCTQTVYELEPALAEFCPNSCTFVPGDWHTTLTGAYDVIVYDLGDATPEEITQLNAHLNVGGLLLGVTP